MWLCFLYPLGIYLGVWIGQRTVGRFGNASGARSIPEYLGERYQSEALRVGSAIFSLILLFYLAGQLVAGLVMFQMLLGLDPGAALAITTLVLLVYVVLGGAHADILTDGVQGLLMVSLAVGITVLFFLGTGAGGFGSLMSTLKADNPAFVQNFNPATALTSSIWPLIGVTITHIPLGLMPHVGNKLWALKDERSRMPFLVMALSFGMIMPLITLGGVLARGVLGDSLIVDGTGANNALPALFIEIFPAWLAALLGVGVLSAIMSTADGLVVSTSQVFANDIYRRTIAPRIHADRDEAALDRNVLIISRVGTVVVLLGAAGLGWAMMDMNVVLLIWAGVGGLSAALMGPRVFGAVWRGVTRLGAIAGFWSGAAMFLLIFWGIGRQGLLGTPEQGTWAADLLFQSTNPYSAAALGALTSVLVTAGVSALTRPLPARHIARVFDGDPAPARDGAGIAPAPAAGVAYSVEETPRS
jgi:Na+/proline symporter